MAAFGTELDGALRSFLVTINGLLICTEFLTKCNVVASNTLNGYSSLPVDRWNVILDSA